MLNAFLQTKRTIKQNKNEFIGWNQGISHYGFWAIEIDDSDWLHYIEKAQAHLQGFAFPNYKRAPHITLTACGLMAESHFSKLHLTKQIEAIKQLDIPPFEISLGDLSSFTTAMYFAITDESNSLTGIRTKLNSIAADHPSENYHPHITLGLYRDNFKTHDVVKCITEFQQRHPIKLKPIQVSSLIFSQYETEVLQGPFEILHRIALN